MAIAVIIIAVLILATVMFLNSLSNAEIDYKNKKKAEQELITENKRQAYEIALQGAYKTKALSAGREYYSSLRSDDRVTLHDEMAIMNDLNCMK